MASPRDWRQCSTFPRKATAVSTMTATMKAIHIQVIHVGRSRGGDGMVGSPKGCIRDFMRLLLWIDGFLKTGGAFCAIGLRCAGLVPKPVSTPGTKQAALMLTARRFVVLHRAYRMQPARSIAIGPLPN